MISLFDTHTALRQLDPANIEKVLIRTTNWLGDAVMTTPALQVVRSRFPHAEIVIAANPVVAELFRHHPACDRIILYDKKDEHRGLTGFFRFCGKLRGQRFDLAILFQNAIEAALMGYFAGIPRRAGFRTDGRGFLLTHPVILSSQDKRLHHIDYYLEMLKRIGIEAGKPGLNLSCTETEIQWAEKLLGEKSWLAINPGAAYGDAKRWFPDRFAQVADRLHQEFGLNVFLTGGANEAETGRDIEYSMRHKPLNMIGQTTVRQLMALLSRAALVVTNDSGPMHIAAAFDVPLVAVFGPTDHTTTSPLSSNARVVRKSFNCSPCLLRTCPAEHECMKAVTTEDVLEAACALLEKHL